MSQWKFADSADSDKPADPPAPASPPPDTEKTEGAAPTPSVTAATAAPTSPPKASGSSPFQFQPSDDPAPAVPPAPKKATATPPSSTPPSPVPPQAAPLTPPMMGQSGNALPAGNPTAPTPTAPGKLPPSPRVPSPTPPPRVPVAGNSGVQAPTPSIPAPSIPASGTPATGVPRPAAPIASAPSPVAPSPVAPSPVAPSPVAPSPVAPAPQVPGASVPGAGMPNAAVPSPAVPPGAVRPSAVAPVPAPAVPAPTAAAPSAPVPSPTYGAAAKSGVPQVATPRAAKSFEDEKVSNFQIREILEKVAPIAQGLFGLCMIFFLASLLYITFGLISSGKLIADATTAPPGISQGDPNASAQAAQQATAALAQAKSQVVTLVNNGHTAAVILSWALVGLALSMAVLAFDLGAIGAVIIGLGAFFLFLVPIGVGKMFDPSIVTKSIVSGLVSPPPLMLVIGIGMLKLLADLFLFFTTIPDKMRSRASVGVPQPADAKQRLAAANANMFSPCWELPFCREVVKKQCPAFLAKKRCWKFGRGCYCDEEMISRIIRGESLEVIKSPTRMSRQGKPPCGKCHIYLEHQRHKFRWLSPLSIPATAALMFFGWKIYLAGFEVFWRGVSPLFAAVSFDSRGMSEKMGFDQNGTDTTFNQISPQQMHDITLNGLAFIVGFLALIYVSKAVEWAIYKLQW